MSLGYISDNRREAKDSEEDVALLMDKIARETVGEGLTQERARRILRFIDVVEGEEEAVLDQVCELVTNISEKELLAEEVELYGSERFGRSV